MLERAAACIEPTAQLFVRRTDPPIRSLRILGQSFWQHGGNDLHTPPWWPLYLQSVRQIPQSPGFLLGDSAIRQLANSTKGPLPGSSRTPQDRKAQPRSDDTPHSRRRPYSHSSLRRQLPLVASDGVNDHNPSSTSQAFPAESNELRNSDRKQVEASRHGRALRFAARHQQTNDGHERVSPPHFTERQQDLEPLSKLVSHQRPNYDRIWKRFIASSDQHGIASVVLAHLAGSSERRDLDRALQVFSIMEIDDRSKADYDVAVRIAVQLRRYSTAIRICQEAANKNADQSCRQILLDGCFSQGLWKTAARVWVDFFEPSLASERDRLSSWNILKAQRNLPTYLSHLCTQLQQDGLSLQVEHATLRAVVASLSLHLFRSPKIMAFTTPGGLFHLLWQFKQLSILVEIHYIAALKTLMSPSMPRQRTDLAVAIYRNFRFMFPDSYIPSRWIVNLIRLCDKDGYPLDIFRYWLQERNLRNAKPNRAIYRQLMWAFSRQGDVDSVEELFRKSVELLGPPTGSSHINPRLYAHAVTGDVDRVQAILQEAKKSYGLTGDIVSWNILLFACSRSKVPRRIFAAFDAMDKRKIHPDTVTFETLIGVCSRIGDATAALSLVEVAKDYNVSITDDMLAMIVHVHCLNDEPNEGEKLALSAQSIGIAMPIRTWNNLLRHYAFQADFRAIRRTRSMMKNTGVDPDEMSYAAVLTSLVRVGKTEDALKLLRTLHFDGTVTATSFHYSIILHGFAMEKNRNMVEVIYREMEERFPQLSPSAQLAKLHMQARRSWRRLLEGAESPAKGSQTLFEKRFKLDIQHAISFVDNVMSQESTGRITSDPQPGFQRQPAHEVLPTIYPETLAGIMAVNRQPIQAQKVLDHYRPPKNLDNGGRTEVPRDNLQTLTSRILVTARLSQWDQVDELWCKILHLGVETGLPGSSVLSMAPSKSQMSYPQSMMDHMVSILEIHGLKVLSAMRFRLSMSLSFYMQALDQQKRHDEIIVLVGNFQRLGFALSTKNWNSYIQVLCRSASHEHRLLAYHIFEEKMLMNTPPWKVISRSKWVARQTNGRPMRLPVSRQLLEQIRPGQIVPTYFTMVFMASVLQPLHSEATRGNSTKLQDLQSRFPRVVGIVERIPLHHDRIHRLILSGMNAHREPMKQPRYHRVFRSGIAGSKSPLDNVSADGLLEALDTDPSRDFILSEGDGLLRDLRTSGLIEGDTIRDRLRRDKHGDFETESDCEARIRRRTSKLLERVEQMRRDSISQPLVMHEPTGDPRHLTRPKNLSPSNDALETTTPLKVRFGVDRSVLEVARSELRERRKAHGRIPLSSMQLGQRLLPPRSRRQEQKNSFSIRKSRRSHEKRYRVDTNKTKEQTSFEMSRHHTQPVGKDQAAVADVHSAFVDTDATDHRSAGLSRKPWVPRGRKWAGDTPGHKLTDKLLPKRTTLPYDREKVHRARRSAREKRRQDALEAALSSGAKGTSAVNGYDRTTSSKKHQRHQEEKTVGREAQNEDRNQDKVKIPEPWMWDQGETGWKF